jgi:hypothetical protein
MGAQLSFLICWDFFSVSHLLDLGFVVCFTFFIVSCVVGFANSLTKELTSRFPTSYLMDVMGVMYSQCGLQVDVEFFSKALHIVESTLLL